MHCRGTTGHLGQLLSGVQNSYVHATGGIVNMRMPNWLERRAADTPRQPALIVAGPQGLRWTFADLDDQTTSLALALAGRGVGAGGRVAVLLHNGPHYVVLVHALIRLGAILSPLNLRLAPTEIAWQLQNAGASLLIHDATTAELAATACAEMPNLPRTQIDSPVPRISGGDAMAADDSPDRRKQPLASMRSDDPSPAPSTHIDLDATHCIMYTSGTTGRPKGAILTYGNHWWSAMGSALNLGLQAGDRWLACLPFFHIGGLSILLRSVIYGIPVVLPENPGTAFDPAAINRAVQQEGVTIVSVVSAMLARMLEADPPLSPGPEAHATAVVAPPREGHASRGLRCLLLGGGPVPQPLLEECARRNLPVVQTYGMTETASQVVTLAPSDALRKLGAAGRPLLPNELCIAVGGGTDATETASRALRVGDDPERSGNTPHAQMEYAVGEILVRGPTVTPGYLPQDGTMGPPVSTVDAAGWLHTGDLGYLDAEGYLYVLDRRADLIITGGENVYPAEVESVLLAHPAIAEAGVYGIADDRWGAAVAAAIVLLPGATLDEAEALAYCRARLAKYKAPSRLRIVEELPRNAAGKVLRRALRGL